MKVINDWWTLSLSLSLRFRRQFRIPLPVRELNENSKDDSIFSINYGLGRSQITTVLEKQSGEVLTSKLLIHPLRRSKKQGSKIPGEIGEKYARKMRHSISCICPRDVPFFENESKRIPPPTPHTAPLGFVVHRAPRGFPVLFYRLDFLPFFQPIFEHAQASISKRSR